MSKPNAIHRFAAKYAGTCAVCGGHIERGETILWTRDRKSEMRHEFCPSALDVSDEDSLNADLAQFLGLWDYDDTVSLAEINAALAEVAL